MADRRAAIALIVLAVALRAGAVLTLESHRVPRSTYEHGEIAANLLAGRGFSVRFLGADGPTSQQAPLYPFAVAGVYALGGVGTPRALLILQLAQSALGGAMVAGVLALVREVAPGRSGMARLAGLIAAVHPTLVYAATHVQVAPLAATLLVWSLAMAYRAGRERGSKVAIVAGLMLGLLALTDPILALVLPGMLGAISLGRGGWRGAIRPGLAVVLAAGLTVTPWIIRNYRVHGEIVLIKSTFGYAFWQGNCSRSEGTDKVVRPSVETALRPEAGGLASLNLAMWKARHEAGYLDDIALSPADYRLLGRMSEPERSRALFRRALADLRADPWRYPRLCLRRLRYFVLFDETNPKARNPIYRASHLGLTLLATVGLIAMPAPIRRRFVPSLVTAGLIAGFHALTIASARFHIPIEPLMAAWASGVLGMGRASQPRTTSQGMIAGGAKGNH